MAQILYVGSSCIGSTSQHRAEALRRLGHEVVIADPYLAVEDRLENLWLGAFHYRTGYRFIQAEIERWLGKILSTRKNFDIAWVDCGELLGPKCLRLFNGAGLSSVLFNHDDPTGQRDGRRFESLLKALSLYDLCAVVRQQNIQEYQALGAKKVIRVWMSYDEVMHAPCLAKADIPECFHSEVVFIGTWMRGEGRDQFMLDLLQRGVPVSIWGQRWQKSPLWEQLKGSYRGGNLSGRDYVAAIQGAKVCLGMLSKGNRDLHTTRTFEIPYAGGLLCAERTSEHLELYKEGVEAVFWRNVDECAQQCTQLLAAATWRESIRLAGMTRVRASRHGHEDVCRLLVQTALQGRTVRPALRTENLH